MAYADYIHCVECDCKVVYYTGDDDIKVLCSKCYKKNLDMIADLLYVWDWWREDEYDRESPVNSIDSVTYNMILGITHQASYLETHNPIRDAIYSEIWNDLERNMK
jgi:hypothetical protein